MSSAFPTEAAVRLDQCPAGALLRYGVDGRLGLMWHNATSRTGDPTHLLDLVAYTAIAMSRMEDDAASEFVFPIALDWRLRLGGESVSCIADVSSAAPGDILSDHDGVWLVATQNNSLHSFGLLSCEGRHKGAPREGLLFKQWSIESVDQPGFRWER